MTISPAYPNLLQNGTAADATQVMADFYQIQNDVNANAAANGANSDITSLTGLTTPLGIAYGGTGSASAAAALMTLGAAPLASPTFTGLVNVPTPAAGNNSTLAATTAFVATSFAPLASPALTGVPTAPTAGLGTNTTQLATTAFIAAAIAAISILPKVKSTTKTDTATVSSTGWADVPGLTATITPAAASSQVHVTGCIQFDVSSNSVIPAFQLVRGATAIDIGAVAGTRSVATNASPGLSYTGVGGMRTISFDFLDSPGSSSPVIYKVQAQSASGTIYINRTVADTDSPGFYRTTSTLSVMEAAA